LASPDDITVLGHHIFTALTADTQLGLLIATIDEDAHSSVYTITPTAPPGKQLVHYHYNLNPLPHHGGTDAISIYHGLILVSASAPGTVGNGPRSRSSLPCTW
jgi:hypothetical protein